MVPQRGKRWWDGLLLRVLLVVGLALLVTIPAAFFLAWLAYGWTPTAIVSQSAKDANFLEPAKIALTLAAGLGGAVAITVAYRRQQVTERAEKSAVQATLRDRYGAAASQLGHEDATVRLAGVYALANLADEWDEQRQQCVDVLCAHMRLPWISTPDPKHPLARTTVERPIPADQGGGTRTYTYPDQLGEVEVRKTILRVIADHLRGEPHTPTPDPWSKLALDITGAELTPGPWSTLALDFTGAELPELDFGKTFIPEQTRFGGATFTGDADFRGAMFTGDAEFRGATFTGDAEFRGATFTGDAEFRGATFTGDADFRGATFTGDADCNKATFTRVADFNEATFTGVAYFNGATFTGDAHFNEAKFNWDAFPDATFNTRAAYFTEATFTGDAYFNEATFAAVADFSGATFTGVAYFNGATFAVAPDFDRAEFAGSISPQIHHYLSDEQLNQNRASPGPEKPRPPTGDELSTSLPRARQ